MKFVRVLGICALIFVILLPFISIPLAADTTTNTNDVGYSGSSTGSVSVTTSTWQGEAFVPAVNCEVYGVQGSFKISGSVSSIQFVFGQYDPTHNLATVILGTLDIDASTISSSAFVTREYDGWHLEITNVNYYYVYARVTTGTGTLLWASAGSLSSDAPGGQLISTVDGQSFGADNTSRLIYEIRGVPAQMTFNAATTGSIQSPSTGIGMPWGQFNNLIPDSNNSWGNWAFGAGWINAGFILQRAAYYGAPWIYDGAGDGTHDAWIAYQGYMGFQVGTDIGFKITAITITFTAQAGNNPTMPDVLVLEPAIPAQGTFITAFDWQKRDTSGTAIVGIQMGNTNRLLYTETIPVSDLYPDANGVAWFWLMDDYHYDNIAPGVIYNGPSQVNDLCYYYGSDSAYPPTLTVDLDLTQTSGPINPITAIARTTVFPTSSIPTATKTTGGGTTAPAHTAPTSAVPTTTTPLIPTQIGNIIGGVTSGVHTTAGHWIILLLFLILGCILLLILTHGSTAGKVLAVAWCALVVGAGMATGFIDAWVIVLVAIIAGAIVIGLILRH